MKKEGRIKRRKSPAGGKDIVSFAKTDNPLLTFHCDRARVTRTETLARASTGNQIMQNI